MTMRGTKILLPQGDLGEMNMRNCLETAKLEKIYDAVLFRRPILLGGTILDDEIALSFQLPRSPFSVSPGDSHPTH